MAQTIPAGFPVLEEMARRNNLLGKGFENYSFTLRPIRNEEDFFSNKIQFEQSDSISDLTSKEKKSRMDFKLLPLLNTTVFNSNRPFGWGNSSLLNGVGWQNLISPGIFAKLFNLQIQLRPEFVFSQNKYFQGYGGDFSDNVTFARFRYWNFGDNPERFTREFNQFSTWGQSFISLAFGKAEIGFSTQNIWWGPGQFTSLIFSDNARGMKHFFVKTKSPINVGIGLMEAQIIFARAEDSGLGATQSLRLNDQFFRPFIGDWRYINGISATFQPSFLKNLSIGLNRTFQQYNDDVEKTFYGRIPVFQAFQKERFFQNGNSVIYDQKAQDQLVSVFFKYKSKKGKFELYSEFGRNDHSFNWREFILNPEHARAYLIGFQKLIQLPNKDKFIQLKGEIIHQQESVNRYIRYPELGVLNTSWQTHYQVRGFTNYGESMGAGIGVGSNAQIIEASVIQGISKFGLALHRIENHQDFFYQVQPEISEKIPWVDFSAGLLWDFKWKNLIVSTSNQMIKGLNYQWRGNPSETIDFKVGNYKTSFSSTVKLIYNFQ